MVCIQKARGSSPLSSTGESSRFSRSYVHVVIGQRARGGCPVMMRLIKERPPGAVVRAWCPKRSEEDVLWVRVAAGTGGRGVSGGGTRGGSGCVSCRRAVAR